MSNKIKNCHWCGVKAEVKYYQTGDDINDKIFNEGDIYE